MLVAHMIIHNNNKTGFTIYITDTMQRQSHSPKIMENIADRARIRNPTENMLLSGVPDLFDRNKILSGGDLSHYQVPHCIRVFFYFVWFVFIHHNFQFYFELCTYCNILDIYLS